MVGPWIAFLPALLTGAKRKLSDIEYLSIKEFDGKLVENEGVLTGTTGTLATLTASTNKDMYLAVAKISMKGGPNNGSLKVELQVNGDVKETFLGEIFAASAEQYEFVSKGFKVITTQVIKLEAITVDAQVIVEGTLSCFEETAGATPQIPST